MTFLNPLFPFGCLQIGDFGATGWLSQLSVWLLISAQVMISLREFKHCIRLCTDSRELASDSVSPCLSAPSPLALSVSLSKINIKEERKRGAWVAQSVKWPTSAQVMISWSVSSSPASGSVLTAQNLEPVSDSVSPSLWPSPIHALSLSVSKINKR